MITSATFKEWMKRVDEILFDHIGFTSEDLRDRCWRDEYDGEATPREAIEELIAPLDDVEEFMEIELFG